ncbi:EMC3/TMCO1 family protein [Candidatus Marsarchaeota archaeon]|jgi:uncharacterized membrane protein (DUF106 family)|nr:EMC3/TMCO1 family protein [Candidatus Marsarchaeota archaeon]MCL5090028.1 EMC3/TMCO1 family protein [Candidatus Marsarchaeota archaeon]
MTTIIPLYIDFLIVALAVIYTVSSVFLQRKLSNPKRMRQIQRTIKEHTKKLNEMIKNKAAKEEITAKQSEIMPLMSESMKNQMKSMLVVFPIFLLLYYELLPQLANTMGFAQDSINLVGFALNYQTFFFVIIFMTGIISTITIMVYDRKKAKEETMLEKSVF